MIQTSMMSVSLSSHDVADGNFGILAFLARILDEFLAAFLRQLWDGDADHRAVASRVYTKIGLLDGLQDIIDRTFVVWCHCEHPCFRHPVRIVASSLLKLSSDFCIFDLASFKTDSLMFFLSHYLLISVPIVSPDTARFILPSSVIENTTSGMSLSIQKDEAVASMTCRFSCSISI